MNETISEITLLWDRVLKKIKTELNDQAIYDSFFSGTYVDGISGNKITVVAGSGFAQTILSTKFLDLVTETIQQTSGTNFEVEFVTEGTAKKPAEEKSAKSSFFAEAHLNAKNTFENFVVGPSNREAFQAALMISRNPGQMFNPLLLHADSGLGKTHLLHALGNEIKKADPSKKVLFISAADFVDEYVKFATGFQEEQTFTSFFKTEVDVLLIDDIQFLVGKKKTMEMFFVAFSTLHSRGKQIVITSDQHPGHLDGLDERLKTRFAQGLVIKIEHPDLATSEQILVSKVSASGLDPQDFDQDAISFLASHFSSSVRDLEGALNRLVFYTINIKPTKHITVEVAREAVASLLEVQEEKTNLSEGKIIATVADYYRLTPSQITGKIRTGQVALARHIVMYLIKTMMGSPTTKIGMALGGRDHTTVMSGISKVENMLKTDPEMAKAVAELKAKISA